MVQKVYISKASDTAVKLELRNFTITVAGAELLIGDITVDNCALTKVVMLISFPAIRH